MNFTYGLTGRPPPAKAPGGPDARWQPSDTQKEMIGTSNRADRVQEHLRYWLFLGFSAESSHIPGTWKTAALKAQCCWRGLIPFLLLVPLHTPGSSHSSSSSPPRCLSLLSPAPPGLAPGEGPGSSEHCPSQRPPTPAPSSPLPPQHLAPVPGQVIPEHHPSPPTAQGKPTLSWGPKPTCK